MNVLNRYLLILFTAFLTVYGSLAHAGPGCVGKMWNPISDVDFRLMGGIRIAGIPLMKSPSHLGSPPNHKVNTVCFCKDGWKTGFGLGLTYWLPTYLADVAREAGCIGFLNGTNILPGFSTLSSGQEYNHHSMAKEGTTSMQIHWAYADIIAIIGSQIFESCDAVSSAFSIGWMTEPDFPFQNDVYSAIMTPHVAILASSALLSQIACGAESVVNTLGGWEDYGICGWDGTRLPLTSTTISKDMAQVTNMDVTLKFLSRHALTGAMLRTMGKDVACKAKWMPTYEAFQHRYQWAYPAKASTRYNVDVLRWGLFVKPNQMMGSTQDAAEDSKKLEGIDASKDSATSSEEDGGGDKFSDQAITIAKGVLDQLPKPLNYPTREAGYMHVWEAKTCCLMVLTVESVAQNIAASLIGDLGGVVKELYDIYDTVSTVYQAITNPIGAVLGAIGDGISNAMGKAMDFVGDWAGDMFDNVKDTVTGGGGGSLSGAAMKDYAVSKGPSAGILQSMGVQ